MISIALLHPKVEHRGLLGNRLDLPNVACLFLIVRGRKPGDCRRIADYDVFELLLRKATVANLGTPQRQPCLWRETNAMREGVADLIPDAIRRVVPPGMLWCKTRAIHQVFKCCRPIRGGSSIHLQVEEADVGVPP